MFKTIKTYNSKTNTWGVTEFSCREEFVEFLWSLWKEPGKYNFNETSLYFNEEARKFNSIKQYCQYPEKTKDFITYWNTEKDKNRNGVIFTDEINTWYIPRDYYMFLNFLPLFNKETGRFSFPDIRDAQYHIALYETIAQYSYKNAALLKKRQIASEQPHSEPVLSENGWITMGDVEAGTRLWNPDGTITTVLLKSINGLKDVYTFEFADGRKTRCGIEHNWEVYDRVKKQITVINTQDILNTGLYNTDVIDKKTNKVYKNHRYAIKHTEPIEFINHSDLLIDPYTLGAILCDGSISTSVYVSGKDQEVFDIISNNLGSEYCLTDGGYCKKNITYPHKFNHPDNVHFENSQYGVNPLLRYLDQLGLRVNNKGVKFIPENYKHSTIENRISLLQGLMDTDGYINATGNNIHFTNVNKRLIDDVAYICRSLGLSVTISEKENKNGKFYRLLFKGKINFDIFRLTRKIKRFRIRSSKTHDLNAIVSINKEDYQEESSCIVVDNPNHLYITKDFIVTHNTYLHMAKILNLYWFEEGSVCKMAASLKDYINEKGAWRYLEEYRNFLNQHTAWYRPSNPDKILNWEQKVEETIGGVKTDIGLKSAIMGLVLDKSVTNGVGGLTTLFYHEEAGMAPKMNTTLEYLMPSLKSGMIYTGMFVAAGSVGDLDQCDPLKELIYHPESKDVLAVETNLMDEHGEIGMCGLFIPEQWSMLPCIDKYGNSLVEEAMELIMVDRVIQKKNKQPEDYQLYISQHPTNIKEAFANRSISRFPLALITKQIRKIEDGEYPCEYVDIEENKEGKYEIKPSNKIPISDFPLSKKSHDKEGVVVMYERPAKDIKFGMYYASVDPVKTGKSTTSESLASIIVYKTPQERIIHKENGQVVTIIEPDKIVCTWAGRFDDLKETHQRLEAIISIYQAWTLVENNVSQFIIYMIERRKQKFLVQKSQIQFRKELTGNSNVYQEYGWSNNGRLFTDNLIPYAIQFLTEELSHETKPDGEIVKTVYGIERIPDIMILKEMQAYREGLNVDRLISFSALAAFARVQQSNLGYQKTHERENENLENTRKNSNFKVSAFRHIGKSSSSLNAHNMNRSAFKNFR